MFTLYVRLSGFYVREAARRLRSGEGEALAVVRDGALLEVNPTAARIGLAPGMAVAEAKAIDPTVRYVAYRSSDYRQAMRAWMDVAAEAGNALEPDGEGAAWIDLSGHPDPASVAVRLLERLADGKAGAGLAQAKWVAKLACPDSPRLAVVEDAAAWLSGLSTEMLAPATSEQRRQLVFLGYRTIGEVASAPRDALAGQFGTDAPRILAAATGGLCEPVAARYPEASRSWRVELPGGAEDSETLSRGLMRLAARVGLGLVEDDLQGQEVWLTLETESGAETLRRSFSKPLASAATLRTALERMIAGWEAKSPVTALRALMPRLKRAERVQTAIQPRGLSRQDAALATALLTVRDALGDRAVIRAADRQESRRERVMRTWRDATGWRAS